MKQSYLPVLIAYRTWPWIRIAALSFRKHFPESPLLIVDNNPDLDTPNWLPRCRLEQDWLATHPDISLIRNTGPDRSPGAGIDMAMQHARQSGFSTLVHFEPDCLISGRDWLERLLDCCDAGAWMCGSHRKNYGPIHPTPSVWKTDVAWSTFAHGARGSDVQHPRFRELFQLDELLTWTRIHEPEAHNWWKDFWDTAQRNWFLAAVHDRAALIEESHDFQHFWYGSQRSPDPTDPRFREYLDQ